ncbi:hypothetical protein RUND412_011551, partial [Rhizina undulata]
MGTKDPGTCTPNYPYNDLDPTKTGTPDPEYTTQRTRTYDPNAHKTQDQTYNGGVGKPQETKTKYNG